MTLSVPPPPIGGDRPQKSASVVTTLQRAWSTPVADGWRAQVFCSNCGTDLSPQLEHPWQYRFPIQLQKRCSCCGMQVYVCILISDEIKDINTELFLAEYRYSKPCVLRLPTKAEIDAAVAIERQRALLKRAYRASRSIEVSPPGTERRRLSDWLDDPLVGGRLRALKEGTRGAVLAAIYRRGTGKEPPRDPSARATRVYSRHEVDQLLKLLPRQGETTA